MNSPIACSKRRERHVERAGPYNPTYYTDPSGQIIKCPAPPWYYGPPLGNPCDANHFYSVFPGGGNWAMCDGSVHFFTYKSALILADLATIAGGEATEVPD